MKRKSPFKPLHASPLQWVIGASEAHRRATLRGGEKSLPPANYWTHFFFFLVIAYESAISVEEYH